MKRFVYLVLAAMFTFMCAGMPVQQAAAEAAPQEATYTSLYSGEVTTLNYLVTSSTSEFAIAANLIDTLVEYDEFGRMQPSLAESWENSDDGLTWTFHLRKDAVWVNGKDEVVAPVVANDFVAAARYILDAKNASATASQLFGVIAGAKEFYLGTSTPAEGEEPAPVMAWDTVGVKALDDTTLQYTLVEPVPYFLSMLTYVNFMPVNEEFLQQKGESFGLATGNDTLLYCGAYYLSEFRPQEIRVLSRSEHNWDKDRVYITKIISKYNKESSNVSPEMYLRGEVDSASLSPELAGDWLNDEKKAAMIHPARLTSYYSYFYTFNFDPQFDAQYEPENWKLAVNNENFRKALMASLDRVKALTVSEPYNPEKLLNNTVTPANFAAAAGKDYTQYDALKDITNGDSFDAAKAVEYRDKAKEELEKEGCTFPIKVLMPYNPSVTNWDKECQVIEQQMEGVLGSDFIDIIVQAGPETGFLSAVRRSGAYAFMKCNWGADYADPQTWAEPFTEGNGYNFWDISEDEGTQAIYQEWTDKVTEAEAICTDDEARYNTFAEAEKLLIDHAIIVPFKIDDGGYTASKLNPLEGEFAPYGVALKRYKFQHLGEKSMSMDEFNTALAEWEEARTKALESAE